MRFEFPWAFLALAAIPLIVWLQLRPRRAGSLRFPTLANVRRAGTSWRQRLRRVPLVLRVLGLAALTVALARPQEGKEQIRDVSKGIAIEMVVDRSGSMGAEMEFGDKRLNRLDVVKKVFSEFVMGNDKGLKGRPNDLVGMIAYARYPDTICPLTLGHGALTRMLESVQIVRRRNEDGTAIGDAIALAAARLKTAEEDLAKRDSPDGSKTYEIKSKVIILLTDGQNNAGKRAPEEAAALAAEWGIRIYTIGVGGEEAVTTVQTPFGDYKMPGGPGVDDETLRAIASRSGGTYRLATDVESLRAVYEEIDRMEKSEVESVRYVDYRELFPAFALLGLVLVAAEAGLANTVFRRLP